jgi:hydrogenase maturation protease
MNDTSASRWTTVVAGLGSPFGDDQAGWRLAEMLRRRIDIPARVVAISDAADLLIALVHCNRLIAVDACYSGNEVGSVTRLRWPDPRIAVRHQRSTHGMGLVEALQLAGRLGDLPLDVEIFGVEIENCSPGREISGRVMRAVARLESQIFEEICATTPEENTKGSRANW